MNTRIKKYLLLIFLVIGMADSALSEGLHTRLNDLQGQQHSLDEFLGKGKWVMFNIWGPRCPPCLEEVSELQSFHEDHFEKDALVVSMALDFPSFGYAKKDEVAAFVEDYFISFPVFLGDSDLARKVTGRPLRGTPTTYFYDPAGKLAVIQVGAVTQNLMERLMGLYGTTAGRDAVGIE